MRPDNKDNAKQKQQKGTKPEKIQDLNDAKVSDKDASDLKGGRMPLNPQPLPPGRN